MVQVLSKSRIKTFDQLRKLIQISVENLQSRALAGELDQSKIQGTDLHMMNYSDVGTDKDKTASRYNVYTLDVNSNIMAAEINEFRQYKKFQKNFQSGKPSRYDQSAVKPIWTATETDQGYHCGSYGHFKINCPRLDLPPTKPAGIHKLASGRVDEDSETSSSDSPSETEVNYVRKRPQVPYKNKSSKKYQGQKSML